MPWKSKAQARWGHTAAGKKALGGEAGVHEWDTATHGKKLPEKVKKSEELEKSVPKMPKDLSKVGKQGITAKMPKAKKAANAFAPPSVFFGKSEEFQGPKHSSLRNLWDFMNKKHKSK